MYKNQLQELAQRSCFNLPSYSCIREGPDHAPRFKSTVNFNGDTFESPQYCSTLRQAEHSAAEVALNALSGRGPSNSLAARVLDETGVYKNLLQEVSQRVGASLPMYSTYRTGLGHLPVFTCTVELAGVIFTGEPAKNKKQAEKNAAMSAWTSLKLLVRQFQTSVSERVRRDEQEHVTVARALQKYLVQARMAKVAFPIMFQTQNPRPPTSPQAQVTSSKILPFIRPTPNRSRAFTMFSPQNRSNLTAGNETSNALDDIGLPPRPPKFPTAGATPYVPIRHFTPHHRFAPPVTIRNAIPVFSSPPRPPVSLSSRVTRPSSPVLVRPPTPLSPIPATIVPCIKSDILLVSKTVDALSENLKSAITISGRVDEHLLSKAPTVLPDTLPQPEVAVVPLEPTPIPKDSVVFPSTSAATTQMPKDSR